MKSCVQKWGNSLAVRIPKSFVDEIGLKDGAAVDVSLSNGKVVVTPMVSKSMLTLAKLLALVTDENLHGQVDTGPPIGNESLTGQNGF